jgi:cytochrome P450
VRVSIATEPGVYYDPYDWDIYNDPYPVFRRLRAEAPLYYNEAHDFYAVSRFADVERVLVDQRHFVNRRGTRLEIVKADVAIPPGTLIFEDEPTHSIHRQLLSRVFTPRAMSAIEPQVRAFCARRLDELADRDRFDFVTEFAQFVPMRVFGMLLGISEADQERVRAFVEERRTSEVGVAYEPGDDFMSGAFYEEFVDHRYRNPGEDLVTRLVSTEFEDEEGVRRTLTRDEAVVYLSVLSGAGNHTTNRLIGWTAKVLGDHPDARRAVVEDRSLVPNAIEEVLRFEPSSTQDARYVAEDVEVLGQVVPAGAAMLCLIGSANRDETVFDDPDTFDVRRQIKHHLTFAYGPHFCLGATLARLEGRVALDELLTRFPDWEVDHAEARLASTPGVRGYASLPIVVR